MWKDPTSFLGTGWDFPPSFGPGGQSVAMTSDQEDVQRSIEILLQTTLGERILQPTYGCDLRRLLFEPLSTTMQAYLKDHLKDQLLYHEPRIVLNHLKISDHRADEGVIEIALEYTITATNTRYNFVYPFYSQEATNLIR
jgi:uncharacterized protein